MYLVENRIVFNQVKRHIIGVYIAVMCPLNSTLGINGIKFEPLKRFRYVKY